MRFVNLYLNSQMLKLHVEILLQFFPCFFPSLYPTYTCYCFGCTERVSFLARSGQEQCQRRVGRRSGCRGWALAARGELSHSEKCLLALHLVTSVLEK